MMEREYWERLRGKVVEVMFCVKLTKFETVVFVVVVLLAFNAVGLELEFAAVVRVEVVVVAGWLPGVVVVAGVVVDDWAAGL